MSEASPRSSGKGGDSEDQGDEEEDRKPAATGVDPSIAAKVPKRAATERENSGNSSGEEEQGAGRRKRRRASATDGSAETPALSPAKVKAPPSLSNAISLQEKWDEMFNRLVRFKEKNGNCLVPNRCKEDPSLGSWVATQRRTYKILNSGGGATSGMNAERAQRLETLGFEWSTTDPRHVPWEERYEELKAFVEKHGHAEVPMRWEFNVQLSNWVSKQRQDYKLLKLGKTSRLTERRRKLLNEIGFIWEISRKGRRLRMAKGVPRGSSAASTDESSASDQGGPSKERHTSSASAPMAATATNRRDQGVASVSGRSHSESHALNSATSSSVPGLQDLLRSTAPALGVTPANTASLFQSRNIQQQLQGLSSLQSPNLLITDFLDQQRHTYGLSQIPHSYTGTPSLAASFTGAQEHPSSFMGAASQLGSVGANTSARLLAAQLRAQNLLGRTHIPPQALELLQQNSILSGYHPSLQLSSLSSQSQYGIGNIPLPSGQMQQQSILRQSLLGSSAELSLLGSTLPSRRGGHDPSGVHAVQGLRPGVLQQQGIGLPPPQAEQQRRTVALPANDQRPLQQQDHGQGESKSETSRSGLQDPDGRTAE